MKTIFLTRDYLRRTRAMAIPGAYWEPSERGYVMPADPTPRTALVALKLLPELAISHPELVAIRERFIQDIKPVNYAEQWWRHEDMQHPRQPLAPSVSGLMAAEGMDYWPFQRIDLSYLAAVLRQHKSAYLGWERGLGKTLGSISIMDELRPERVLVLSSNTAKTAVWQPELQRWGAGWMPQVRVLPNDNTPRQKHGQPIPHSGRRDVWTQWMFDHRHEPQVNLIHYQALNLIRKGRGGWKRYGRWDMVIADEFHHFSNKHTDMTRALKNIPADMKLGVSGSIISNHASELYSQLNWLYPSRYHAEERDWSDRFLDWVDLEGHREYIGVRLDRVDALRDELGRFLTYRRKADELDLPPILIQDLPITLGGRQRRVYDELSRDAISLLDSGEVLTAANGGALLTRLRMVATGLNLVSGELEDSAKFDAAVDLITDNPDEPFVVFSYFIGAAEALARRLENLGIKTFTVHEGVKNADRTDYIGRFQAGEGRVFVGTLGTLGESVTLSRAANVIFLDRSWNPQLNDQAVDRVAGGFRALQVGRPITISNLVAAETVDESKVTPVLSSKEAVRAVILGRGR